MCLHVYEYLCSIVIIIYLDLYLVFTIWRGVSMQKNHNLASHGFSSLCRAVSVAVLALEKSGAGPSVLKDFPAQI